LADGRRFENRQSLYLSNGSTYRREMRPLKFRIIRNPRWRTATL